MSETTKTIATFDPTNSDGSRVIVEELWIPFVTSYRLTVEGRRGDYPRPAVVLETGTGSDQRPLMLEIAKRIADGMLTIEPCPAGIADSEIRALRAELEDIGQVEMVAICDVALGAQAKGLDVLEARRWCEARLVERAAS